MEKVQSVTDKLRNKIQSNRVVTNVKKGFVTAGILAENAILFSTNVYAENDPMTAIKNILDIIMQKLFPAIGIVLALVGAFKLFMAFRNDQPDAYSGAAKDIVIGVVLSTFAGIVWPVISAQF